MRPLITTGIACYNAEGTVGRAVESALAQTWPEREILIVDDASTDESPAVLRQLARAYPEIRVIRHERNRGFPSAANTVITQARGAFIAFLGDDDESAPDRLERQYRRIAEYEAEHPGAMVLCYSNRNVVPVGEEEPGFQRLGIGRVPPEPSGPLVAEYVLGLVKDDGRHSWGMAGSGTLMARVEAFRHLGGFDDRFRRGADVDFAVRAALGGAHFISVDAPLITQHITQTPDKAGRIELQYNLLVLQKHKSYLKRKGSYLGAWCNKHAQFYYGRHWRWRLWYLAALACFPWRVSRERLKRSSLLDRLGLLRIARLGSGRRGRRRGGRCLGLAVPAGRRDRTRNAARGRADNAGRARLGQ
jgi:glycosyltransferase involved in cell wall biosynthesis